MAFGPFLAALGLAAVKAEARFLARRAALRIAVAAATGVLLLLALGFGVAAFTVWLAGEVGTINALLIVAGIMLVLALIVQGVARFAGSRRRRPASAPPPSPPAAGSAAPPVDAAEPPAGSVLGSVAIVALAGFLLARQMFRRR